jgi:hypothetical protein
MTRITLLTKTDCELCDQAKSVLARVALDLPIEIEVVALTSEAGQRLARDAGVLFPPGVLLDGEPFSYGRLSERRLRRALARKSHPSPSPVRDDNDLAR